MTSSDLSAVMCSMVSFSMIDSTGSLHKKRFTYVTMSTARHRGSFQPILFCSSDGLLNFRLPFDYMMLRPTLASTLKFRSILPRSLAWRVCRILFLECRLDDATQPGPRARSSTDLAPEFWALAQARSGTRSRQKLTGLRGFGRERKEGRETPERKHLPS